jgi:hypothetical protein
MILNQLRPDYIVLSHMSIDHFDLKQVLAIISRHTKVLCNIQCYERLYVPFKELGFLENLICIFNGDNYSDEKVSIKVLTSLHGDYLEPITCKISFQDSGNTLYHGFDSLMLDDDQYMKIQRVDYSILPLSIAPSVNLNLFNKLRGRINSTATIINHALSSEVKNLEKIEDVMLLDWDQGCFVSLDDNIKDENIEIDNFSESKTDILHSSEIVKFLKFGNANERYKSAFYCAKYSISQPLEFKEFLYEPTRDYLLKFIGKISMSKIEKRISSTLLWGLSNYYLYSNTIINEDKVIFRKLATQDDQFIIYWLCESLSQISISNWENYLFSKELFLNVKRSTCWNEVLNRRVFAWSIFYVLNRRFDFCVADISSYENMLSEFIKDKNPDVRLIGIMGFEVVAKYNTNLTNSTTLKRVAREACFDSESELVEASLNLFSTLLQMDPALSKEIKTFIKRNITFYKNHNNWYVNFKLNMLLN